MTTGVPPPGAAGTLLTNSEIEVQSEAANAIAPSIIADGERPRPATVKWSRKCVANHQRVTRSQFEAMVRRTRVVREQQLNARRPTAPVTDKPDATESRKPISSLLRKSQLQHLFSWISAATKFVTRIGAANAYLTTAKAERDRDPNNTRLCRNYRKAGVNLSRLITYADKAASLPWTTCPTRSDLLLTDKAIVINARVRVGLAHGQGVSHCTFPHIDKLFAGHDNLAIEIDCAHPASCDRGLKVGYMATWRHNMIRDLIINLVKEIGGAANEDPPIASAAHIATDFIAGHPQQRPRLRAGASSLRKPPWAAAPTLTTKESEYIPRVSERIIARLDGSKGDILVQLDYHNRPIVIDITINSNRGKIALKDQIIPAVARGEGAIVKQFLESNEVRKLDHYKKVCEKALTTAIQADGTLQNVEIFENDPLGAIGLQLIPVALTPFGNMGKIGDEFLKTLAIAAIAKFECGLNHPVPEKAKRRMEVDLLKTYRSVIAVGIAKALALSMTKHLSVGQARYHPAAVREGLHVQTRAENSVPGWNRSIGNRDNGGIAIHNGGLLPRPNPMRGFVSRIE